MSDHSDYFTSHAYLRTHKTWRSFGVDGLAAPTDTLIGEIGDAHLINIIKYLEEHGRTHVPSYQIMHDEIAWRLHGTWQTLS